MSAPVETKVVAGSGAALVVATIFGALAYWVPGFQSPPAYLTSLIVTIVSLAAGYLAPHTPRPPAVQPPPLGNKVLSPPVSSARPQ